MADVTLPVFCLAMTALLFGDLHWKARWARVAGIGLMVAGSCYLLSRLFFETQILAPIPADLAALLDYAAPAALIVAAVLRVWLHYRTPQEAGA